MKNVKVFFIVLAALVTLLSGCIPATPVDNPASDTSSAATPGVNLMPDTPPAESLTQSTSEPPAPSKIVQSNISRETNPSIPTSAAQLLVSGNNTFAVDLYQALAKQNSNLIYSPFSISLALAMTYAGARGQTEAQMTDSLHFTLGQNSTHSAFNALDLKIAQNGASMKNNQVAMQLNLANALWAEQTYPFQQDFLDTIARNYGAGIQLADFINQSGPTRKEINNWVSDQTNNKIQDLLAEGVLNSDTRMVVVNAIYFKADWWNVFDPSKTSDAPFHLLDGSTTQVKMMSNSLNSVLYTSGDGYQAIELPYAGGIAAMDILVPDEGKFPGFESSLNADKLNEILQALQPAAIQLGLPKFKFADEFSLREQLSVLGMSDAFDPSLADFSGMTGNRDVFLSDVIHKAFVAVDEKGTEAAAATAGTVQLSRGSVSQIILTIDRPFIFAIRDTISGQILFMGRLVNPAQ